MTSRLRPTDSTAQMRVIAASLGTSRRTTQSAQEGTACHSQQACGRSRPACTRFWSRLVRVSARPSRSAMFLGGGVATERGELEAVIGSDLLALTHRFSEWVPRREERFEYVNHAIVRRTVRVDIDLSGFYPILDDMPVWRGLAIVPIAVLRRDRHTTFEVRAEDGALLPRLTAHEERSFVFQGVVAQATMSLADALTTASRDALYQIVTEPPTVTVADTEQLGELRSKPEFAQTLSHVRRFYYLLTPLRPESGHRRVVTYSYLEPIVVPSEETRTAIETAFAHNGLDKTAPAGERRITAEIANAGDCRSYHLEVVAPPALRIVDAQLRVQEAAHGSNPQDVGDNDRLATHAHMHISDLGALSWGAFTCRMMLSSTGIVRAAVASSLFAFASLVTIAGLIWLPGVVWFVHSDLDQSAGTSAFLLIPGAVGPILATTSNHGLTTSLLLPTRLLMWLTGAASFIAAGAVATGLEGALRIVAWAAACALSATCALFLTRQFVRLRAAERS